MKEDVLMSYVKILRQLPEPALVTLGFAAWAVGIIVLTQITCWLIGECEAYPTSLPYDSFGPAQFPHSK